MCRWHVAGSLDGKVESIPDEGFSGFTVTLSEPFSQNVVSRFGRVDGVGRRFGCNQIAFHILCPIRYQSDKLIQGPWTGYPQRIPNSISLALFGTHLFPSLKNRYRKEGKDHMWISPTRHTRLLTILHPIQIQPPFLPRFCFHTVPLQPWTSRRCSTYWPF